MEVAANGMTARVILRGVSERAWPQTRHRVVVGLAEPGAEQIDVTGGVVSAIAHSLWQARGGDPAANWADAERALDALCARAAALEGSEPVAHGVGGAGDERQGKMGRAAEPKARPVSSGASATAAGGKRVSAAKKPAAR